MNTYKIKHRALCPNGGLVDNYHITLRSVETILVEDILRHLSDMPKTIYHEDLATILRNKIGCEVSVIGWHHGVKVKCKRK